MAEHKKPARPKAEEATKKPQAEEQSPTADVKEDAAQLVAQDASRQAMGHGLKEVQVLVKGPGAGRESAVRALQAIGLDLTLIRDVTPVPHNGCRPPKQRRV